MNEDLSKLPTNDIINLNNYIYIYSWLKQNTNTKMPRFFPAPMEEFTPGIESPRLGQQKVTEELAEKTHEEVVRKTSRKKHAIRYRFGDFRKV